MQARRQIYSAAIIHTYYAVWFCIGCGVVILQHGYHFEVKSLHMLLVEGIFKIVSLYQLH